MIFFSFHIRKVSSEESLSLFVRKGRGSIGKGKPFPTNSISHPLSFLSFDDEIRHLLGNFFHGIFPITFHRPMGHPMSAQPIVQDQKARISF
jgi:hypothetical protein